MRYSEKSDKKGTKLYWDVFPMRRKRLIVGCASTAASHFGNQNKIPWSRGGAPEKFYIWGHFLASEDSDFGWNNKGKDIILRSIYLVMGLVLLVHNLCLNTHLHHNDVKGYKYRLLYWLNGDGDLTTLAIDDGNSMATLLWQHYCDGDFILTATVTVTLTATWWWIYFGGNMTETVTATVF